VLLSRTSGSRTRSKVSYVSLIQDFPVCLVSNTALFVNNEEKSRKPCSLSSKLVSLSLNLKCDVCVEKCCHFLAVLFISMTIMSMVITQSATAIDCFKTAGESSKIFKEFEVQGQWLCSQEQGQGLANSR